MSGLLTDLRTDYPEEIEDELWLEVIAKYKQERRAAANQLEAQAKEIAELRAALGEAHTELVFAEKFISMRERMHPDGQALYREVIERIENLVS